MATIQRHEFDTNRFDVVTTDSTYYVRMVGGDARDDWLRALETSKRLLREMGGLSRRPSAVSLAAQSMSSAAVESTTGASGTAGSAREKLAEAVTYRDILLNQVSVH